MKKKPPKKRAPARNRGVVTKPASPGLFQVTRRASSGDVLQEPAEVRHARLSEGADPGSLFSEECDRLFEHQPISWPASASSEIGDKDAIQNLKPN